MRPDMLMWTKLQEHCTRRSPWTRIDGRWTRLMLVLGETVRVRRPDRTDRWGPGIHCDMSDTLRAALEREPDIGWIRRLGCFGEWEMDMDERVTTEVTGWRRRMMYTWSMPVCWNTCSHGRAACTRAGTRP